MCPILNGLDTVGPPVVTWHTKFRNRFACPGCQKIGLVGVIDSRDQVRNPDADRLCRVTEWQVGPSRTTLTRHLWPGFASAVVMSEPRDRLRVRRTIGGVQWVKPTHTGLVTVTVKAPCSTKRLCSTATATRTGVLNIGEAFEIVIVSNNRSVQELAGHTAGSCVLDHTRFN